jgi:GNAT superfamily N-acetyltransferase
MPDSVSIRPARWPDDLALLQGLDTSFTTDRIYDARGDGLGFTLAEEAVDPPLHKAYGSAADLEPRLSEADFAVVAENEEGLVGLAAVKVEAWNRRAVVWHLYVAKAACRSGIGAALLKETEAFARSVGARCLWVETQNVNYPAIQFYRRVGFRLCGLDDSLYDPPAHGRNEVALFFVRELI